jgi:hypothetical protein
VNLFGYRQWRMEDGRLHSFVYRREPWSPNVTTFHCDEPSDHLAQLGITPGNFYEMAMLAHAHADQVRPLRHHSCGLYAYRDPKHVGSKGAVAGLVLLTGRVLVYSHGFRAQRGRILALVDKNPAKLRRRLHPDYRALEIVATWKAAEQIRLRWEEVE